MNTETTTKVPSTLVLTCLLSGGITIVVSLCYIVLSLLALFYSFNCDETNQDEIDSSQFFWNTIVKVYFQNEDCGHVSVPEDITQPFTVFVLIILTLAFSVVTLITGIVLAVLIKNEDGNQYLYAYVFTYIGSWVCSLVVDLTFATHLGIDYTTLTNMLEGIDLANYNYTIDVIRQGAFYLMAISLKGFVIHAVNLVLIVVMIVYVYEYNGMLKKEEHSIHKLGALNAYDQPRRQDDNNWLQPEMYAGPFGRGQLNNGYLDEEPRRSTNRVEPYNAKRSPGYSHSDSWQTPQIQPHSSSQGSRPFSYLENVQRPVPVKPVPSPTAPDGWRRDPWQQAPPVPAPDYSPHTPRRLKSALKPGYM